MNEYISGMNQSSNQSIDWWNMTYVLNFGGTVKDIKIWFTGMMVSYEKKIKIHYTVEKRRTFINNSAFWSSWAMSKASENKIKWEDCKIER